MRAKRSLLITVMTLGGCSVGYGQMISLQTPLQSNSGSFYERTGFSWGIDIPSSGGIIGLMPNGQPTPDGSIPIRFGGLNSALPPFGGFDPGADATVGFRWRNRGGGGGFFNMALAQASNRTSTTVTPSLTLTNGYPGYIFDGQVRPFVTGFVPVVGNNELARPAAPPRSISPLQARIERLRSGERGHDSDGAVPSTNPAALPERLAPTGDERSSAVTGDRSLRAIRAQNSANQPDSVQHQELVARARSEQAHGRPYAARQLLRRAHKVAPPARKSAIAAELDRLNRSIEEMRRK